VTAFQSDSDALFEARPHYLSMYPLYVWGGNLPLRIQFDPIQFQHNSVSSFKISKIVRSFNISEVADRNQS
jgi:hypothetical protein